ncbi:hypothetical protein [Kribbella flavida]|uniref:hypothetical protein n=1 Tax=Kribbella flavida TaxID=182640 RepID=UPI00019BD92E|nr:hypothetical protein [Kribbella flavida]
MVEDVLLRTATSALRLQLPRSGEQLRGVMVRTRPAATGLRIIADGDPVPLQQTALRSAQTLPLDSAATRLTMTYRLSGSSTRSLPSRVGRALAVISPLTAATDATLPTNLTVSGGGLLNANCPLLAEPRCAVGEPPGLGIQQGIPAGQALAVLQLDLPLHP